MNDLVNHLRIQWVVEGGGGEGEMQVIRFLRLSTGVAMCGLKGIFVRIVLGALISVG